MAEVFGFFVALCALVWGGGFYLERRGVNQKVIVWVAFTLFASGVFLIGRFVESWR